MKIKFVSLALVVALIFSGCSIDVGMVIQSDKKLTMSMQMDIEKDAFDQVMAQSGENQAEMNEILKQMSVVTIDGKQYYELKEAEGVQTKEIMSAYEEIGQKCYITKNTFYLKAEVPKNGDSLSGMISPGELNELTGGALSSINLSDMKETFTIEFPKKVVSTTGVIDAKNPQKVVFHVPNDPKVTSFTMFATTDSKITIKSVQNLIKQSGKIKRPVIKSVKAGKVKKKSKYASATVKLKKIKDARKYYVEYSTKRSFAGKFAEVSSKKATIKLKKLKKNKKYFIRVYADKKDYKGEIVISKASKIKKVKTKK